MRSMVYNTIVSLKQYTSLWGFFIMPRIPKLEVELNAIGTEELEQSVAEDLLVPDPDDTVCRCLNSKFYSSPTKCNCKGAKHDEIKNS